MSRARSAHATTLDILEDSLNSLYKARKKGLMAKQAKFERQQKKRMIQNQKGLRPKTPNPNVDYTVDDDDADEDAFVDSLASSLTMEPMASVPHSRSIQAAADEGPKGQVKQFNYNQVKDTPALFKGSSDSFTPLGEMKEDQAAAKAFLDFRNEMEAWWKRNVVKRHDTEARAEMADYFSDAYLTKRLDPLPNSKAVSQFRKSMASIIDQFANPEEEMGKDWPAKVFNFEIPGDMGAAMRGGEEEKEVEEVGHDERGPAGHQRRRAMAREDEKQKMKQEYERYMELKKNTETHPDNDKVQEYERLQDEIKSLMSTINTVPQLDKDP